MKFQSLFVTKNSTRLMGTALAVLAGSTILFAASSARAEENHPITACGATIEHPGKYYLANDLKQCAGVGITVTAGHVLIELRGHTIQGAGNADGIDIVGGSDGISDVEIAGPGTVTGAKVGLSLENVHWSSVHDVVSVENVFGMTVNASNFTSNATITATASTDNRIVNNVLIENAAHGISVNGGNRNQFVGNNSSGNGTQPPGEGILLFFAADNVVRGNTMDSNDGNGIDTGILGTGNRIEDNVALSNAYGDLNDGNNSCSDNEWRNNSSESDSPSCLQ